MRPNECNNNNDCSGCEVCGLVGSIKKCVAGPTSGTGAGDGRCECESAEHCKTGDVCIKGDPGEPLGVCRGPSTGECLLDSDCESGTVCKKANAGDEVGSCVTQCQSHDQCAAGEYCQKNSPNAAKGGCMPGCRSNAECQTGCQYCSNGTCVDSPSGGSGGQCGCESDSQCQPGSQCYKQNFSDRYGVCLATCGSNDDCAAGTFCKAPYPGASYGKCESGCRSSSDCEPEEVCQTSTGFCEFDPGKTCDSNEDCSGCMVCRPKEGKNYSICVNGPVSGNRVTSGRCECQGDLDCKNGGVCENKNGGEFGICQGRSYGDCSTDSQCQGAAMCEKLSGNQYGNCTGRPCSEENGCPASWQYCPEGGGACEKKELCESGGDCESHEMCDIGGEQITVPDISTGTTKIMYRCVLNKMEGRCYSKTDCATGQKCEFKTADDRAGYCVSISSGCATAADCCNGQVPCNKTCEITNGKGVCKTIDTGCATAADCCNGQVPCNKTCKITNGKGVCETIDTGCSSTADCCTGPSLCFYTCVISDGKGVCKMAEGCQSDADCCAITINGTCNMKCDIVSGSASGVCKSSDEGDDDDSGDDDDGDDDGGDDDGGDDDGGDDDGGGGGGGGGGKGDDDDDDDDGNGCRRSSDCPKGMRCQIRDGEGSCVSRGDDNDPLPTCAAGYGDVGYAGDGCYYFAYTAQAKSGTRITGTKPCYKKSSNSWQWCSDSAASLMSPSSIDNIKTYRAGDRVCGGMEIPHGAPPTDRVCAKTRTLHSQCCAPESKYSPDREYPDYEWDSQQEKDIDVCMVADGTGKFSVVDGNYYCEECNYRLKAKKPC
ncbi:MAG: hypothetical protein ACOY3K_01175 [Candidatus Omnitrophota bacterium]